MSNQTTDLATLAKAQGPRPPVASTTEMRERIRELINPGADDFDRAVLIVLDDLERLVRHYGL